MEIRKYQLGEERELWELFFNTIRTVNVRDYSSRQVQTWAPDEFDEARWRAKIADIDPYVCVHENKIVGYTDLQDSGYIDHFYVHHRWQGQGVGKLLFSTIELEARRQGIAELSANVSITARPFFESRGFTVVAPQEVTLRGIVFVNFKMVKRLSGE